MPTTMMHPVPWQPIVLVELEPLQDQLLKGKTVDGQTLPPL
jgi:hypothetical protein